jgi:hypothetical protein
LLAVRMQLPSAMRMTMARHKAKKICEILSHIVE